MFFTKCIVWEMLLGKCLPPCNQTGCTLCEILETKRVALLQLGKGWVSCMFKHIPVYTCCIGMHWFPKTNITGQRAAISMKILAGYNHHLEGITRFLSNIFHFHKVFVLVFPIHQRLRFCFGQLNKHMFLWICCCKKQRFPGDFFLSCVGDSIFSRWTPNSHRVSLAAVGFQPFVVYHLHHCVPVCFLPEEDIFVIKLIVTIPAWTPPALSGKNRLGWILFHWQFHRFNDSDLLRFTSMKICPSAVFLLCLSQAWELDFRVFIHDLSCIPNYWVLGAGPNHFFKKISGPLSCSERQPDQNLGFEKKLGSLGVWPHFFGK